MSIPFKIASIKSPPIVKTTSLKLIPTAELKTILQNSEILSEGWTVEDRGERVYYGSCIITIDLDRKTSDEEFKAIAAHIKKNPLLHIHLTRIARFSAMLNSTITPLSTARFTVSTRIEGRSIKLTIDIEIGRK